MPRPNYFLNIPVAPYVTADRVKALSDGSALFRHRPDDVWLCSYPRSGTTLAQGILCALLSRDAGTKNRYEIVPWPEVGSPSVPCCASFDSLEKLPSPRCFKSHWLPTDHVGPDKKVIHVSRDVCDVVTSLFRFAKIEKKGEPAFPGDFQSFFEMFVAGERGSWFDHQWAWLTSGHKNILRLKYEDLLDRKAESIRTIGSFVGIALSDSDVLRTIELSSFSFMKSRSMKAREDPPGHYRRGAIGDHVNLLSPAQIGTLREMERKMMDEVAALRTA
jgi:hypothetical protein